MTLDTESANLILNTYNVVTLMRQLYSGPVYQHDYWDMQTVLTISELNGWVRMPEDGTIHLTPKGRFVARQIIRGCDDKVLMEANTQWSEMEDIADRFRDYHVLGALVSLSYGYLPDMEDFQYLEPMLGGPLILPDGNDGYILTEGCKNLVRRAEKLRLSMWGEELLEG